MLGQYIKEVADTSISSAVASSALIEAGICILIFILPTFISKRFKFDDIEYEKSFRKIFLWKFFNKTEWRVGGVLTIGFITHFFFVSPYEVYRNLKSQQINWQQNVKIIQWRPPQMSNEVNGCCIYLGGHFEDLPSRTFMPGASPQININMDQFRSKKEIVIPIWGSPATTVYLSKNRVYLDLQIPTKTKPIQISAGESTALPDGWDYNSDSNAMEIVDDQNQAVFQEIYLQPNVVWIKGAIQAAGAIIPLNEYSSSGPISHGLFSASDLGLRNIFRYPSTKYPHERMEY
jgi:hypothetical protein